MRVRHIGKVYTFDPAKQEKRTLLDIIAEKLPIPLRWKVWLATQSTKLKGIQVEK